jgi:hypothetical protein
VVRSGATGSHTSTTMLGSPPGIATGVLTAACGRWRPNTGVRSHNQQITAPHSTLDTHARGRTAKPETSTNARHLPEGQPGRPEDNRAFADLLFGWPARVRAAAVLRHTISQPAQQRLITTNTRHTYANARHGGGGQGRGWPDQAPGRRPAVTKCRQAPGLNLRCGPVFLESRTAAPVEAKATSRQSLPASPLKLLFLQAVALIPLTPSVVPAGQGGNQLA